MRLLRSLSPEQYDLFSGDPFDDFDDFAQLTSPSSSVPLTPLSSCTPTTTTATSIVSSPPHPPLRSFLTSLSPVECLSRILPSLCPIPPSTSVSPSILRPTLTTFHRLLPQLPNHTHAVHIRVALIHIREALSTHLVSPSLSTQICRLFSQALNITNIYDLVPMLSLIPLLREMLSKHLPVDLSAVDAALHLIGSICLHLHHKPTHFPLATTLFQNRLLHWTLAAMRHWPDAPRLQHTILRALCAMARADMEVAMHLVSTHSIFPHLILVLHALVEHAHVSLVADLLQTVTILVALSAEFRRLSVCDSVPQSCLAVARAPHLLAYPRVVAALSSMAVVYLRDAETTPLLLRLQILPILLQALVQMPGPTHTTVHPSSSSSSSFNNSAPRVLSTSSWALPPSTRHSQSPFQEPLSTCVPVPEAVAAVFLAFLVALQNPSSSSPHHQQHAFFHSRPHCLHIADVVLRHADDLQVICAALSFLCQLCRVEQQPFSRNTSSIPPRPVIDLVISVAAHALSTHLLHRQKPVLRRAVQLLLLVCHAGYRRLLLRRFPNTPRAVEHILQEHPADEAIALPAGALLMKLR